jgi:phospholipid transport system substrate-binding protein
MIKIILSALFVLTVGVHSLIADNQPSAEELLKKNLTAVFAVLNEPGLSPDAKKNEIERILNPMFDFALMAKLTLGREYWPDLSADQRVRFTKLFIDRLRASYLDRLALYTDEKVQYEPAVSVKTKVQIPTYLVSKEDKISILYKFYDSSSGWRIYDLEVQGVSIIRSYRSQFHEILRSGSFDDLMAKLERSAEDQQ